MKQDSQNPYLNNEGESALQESVVAYLDVLGYEQIIRSVHAEGRDDAFLAELRSILDTAYGYLRESATSVFSGKDSFVIRTFTDNVVVGYPIVADGEFELGSIFNDLSYVQLLMAQKGLFLRGAISVGELYMDSDIVFGSALLEAYEAERELARDPRIVLSKSARDHASAHIEYYSAPEISPQSRDIYIDADGQWFLNYMETVLIAEDDHGPYVDDLVKHRDAVELKLAEHRSNPAIWSKYAWVARYHNFFCDQYSYFDDSHKIAIDNLQLTPRRIPDD